MSGAAAPPARHGLGDAPAVNFGAYLLDAAPPVPPISWLERHHPNWHRLTVGERVTRLVQLEPSNEKELLRILGEKPPRRHHRNRPNSERGQRWPHSGAPAWRPGSAPRQPPRRNSTPHRLGPGDPVSSAWMWRSFEEPRAIVMSRRIAQPAAVFGFRADTEILTTQVPALPHRPAGLCYM